MLVIYGVIGGEEKRKVGKGGRSEGKGRRIKTGQGQGVGRDAGAWPAASVHLANKHWDTGRRLFIFTPGWAGGRPWQHLRGEKVGVEVRHCDKRVTCAPFGAGPARLLLPCNLAPQLLSLRDILT